MSKFKLEQMLLTVNFFVNRHQFLLIRHKVKSSSVSYDQNSNRNPSFNHVSQAPQPRPDK